MILLVGLGNPGTEYANTRHNVGFMAVDEIVRRYHFDSFTKKFKGELSVGMFGTEKVLVLKPQTYMNLSGESVLATASFYKIPPNNIYVFHDDMDLPVGRLKVKTGGGSGGHNGIKNIDSHLGTNYHRIRIGVDKPLMREQVISWVLSAFSSDEKKCLDGVIDKIADNIACLWEKDGNFFMNKVK